MKKKLLVLVLALTIILSQNTYSAKANTYKIYDLTFYCAKGEAYYTWFYSELDGYSKDMTFKNIKSSNKKVCIADYDTSESKEYYRVVFKSPGYATVSGDVYKSGKLVGTFTQKVTLLKYKNPFKKLKIGKKNFAKYFKKKLQPNIKLKKAAKAKIKVKLKKGFKLGEIYTSHAKKNGSLNNKIVKNGSKIKISTKDFVQIIVYNKKKTSSMCCIMWFVK